MLQCGQCYLIYLNQDRNKKKLSAIKLLKKYRFKSLLHGSLSIIVSILQPLVTKPKNLDCKNSNFDNSKSQRGTMFCLTLKLKEVLNKQILSASVLEAAVLI